MTRLINYRSWRIWCLTFVLLGLGLYFFIQLSEWLNPQAYGGLTLTALLLFLLLGVLLLIYAEHFGIFYAVQEKTTPVSPENSPPPRTRMSHLSPDSLQPYYGHGNETDMESDAGSCIVDIDQLDNNPDFAPPPPYDHVAEDAPPPYPFSADEEPPPVEIDLKIE